MIAKEALAQANLLPFSPSLKSGLLRHRRLSLAAQLAQQAPAGACCGEFFNFSCNDRTRKKPFFFPTPKSKCCCSIRQEKGPGTKSISVIAKGAWYKINFNGLQPSRNQVRTNSDYRICTCSILYGLVSKPALPPESPQQIGFGGKRNWNKL